MMSKPNQQKSDELVNLPKIISATVKWKKHAQGWRLKAKAVAINGEESFELLAYAAKTNYSFALLYKKYPLRKFTKHSPHKIGGILFDKPHKHVWNGTTENKIGKRSVPIYGTLVSYQPPYIGVSVEKCVEIFKKRFGSKFVAPHI